MRPADVRSLLRTEPFEPVRLGLSDGRSVLVRHPDQVVVSQRVIFVGLATVGHSEPLATPDSGDEVARDWMIVNLRHVATAEPRDGGRGHS